MTKLLCDERALECEICNRWYHADCQKVSDQLYAALQADSQAGTNFVHWYCNTSCNFFAKKFINTVFSLKKDIDDVAGAVGGLEKRVGNIKQGNITTNLSESVRQIVKEEMKNETMGVQDSIQQIENFRSIMESQQMENLENGCNQIETVNKFMNEKAREQWLEQEDRTRRQSNLIIFDLPESTAENVSDKKKDDSERINQILDEIGVEISPIFTKRLFKRRGKFGRREEPIINETDENDPQKNENKKQYCTPILLKFQNPFDRDDVLKKFIASKKDAEEDNYEGEEDKLYLTIRMKRDMTPQERQEDFALYSGVKSRREQSKNDGDHTERQNSEYREISAQNIPAAVSDRTTPINSRTHNNVNNFNHSSTFFIWFFIMQI